MQPLTLHLHTPMQRFAFNVVLFSGAATTAEVATPGSFTAICFDPAAGAVAAFHDATRVLWMCATVFHEVHCAATARWRVYSSIG